MCRGLCCPFLLPASPPLVLEAIAPEMRSHLVQSGLHQVPRVDRVIQGDRPRHWLCCGQPALLLGVLPRSPTASMVPNRNIATTALAKSVALPPPITKMTAGGS